MPSYKQLKLIRFIIFIVTLFLLLLTVVKLYYSYDKVTTYQSAMEHLEANRLVLAESDFTSAEQNIFLEYHEEEISKELVSLGYISEIKNVLETLLEEIDQSKNVSSMVKNHTHYLSILEKSSPTELQIVKELLAQYKVEEALSDEFEMSIEDSIKDLRDFDKDNKFKSNSSAVDLLLIPSVYYGGDIAKIKLIQEELHTYHQAHFTQLRNSDTSIREGMELATELVTFYKKYNLEAAWIIEETNAYAIHVMKKLEVAKDRKNFFLDAKLAEQYTQLLGANSELSLYINESVNSLLNEALQLIASKKYSDAISVYEEFNPYLDFSKEIQNTQITWYTNEPKALLSKQFPEIKFDIVKGDKDLWGGKVYVYGLANKQMKFIRLLSNNTIQSATIEDANGLLKNSKISVVNTYSPKGNPIVMVDAASNSRKHRYMAFEMRDTKFQKIFDIEGDAIVQETIGTLVVDNGIGEGAGQKAYYKLNSGVYAYAGIKPDYIVISMKDLPKHKNVKVRFECTILTADGTTGVVALNDAYILLTGKPGFSEGKVTVTGKYTRSEFIQKGNQKIDAYVFEVSEFK